MAIFNSYVSLPEGKSLVLVNPNHYYIPLVYPLLYYLLVYHKSICKSQIHEIPLLYQFIMIFRIEMAIYMGECTILRHTRINRYIDYRL